MRVHEWSCEVKRVSFTFRVLCVPQHRAWSRHCVESMAGVHVDGCGWSSTRWSLKARRSPLSTRSLADVAISVGTQPRALASVASGVIELLTFSHTLIL